jgi:hypothetical protein
MMSDLNWAPLEVRRIRYRLIFFYKVIHHLVAIPYSNQGRYWDHALETVNCVCSGKCCGQLIPKCDRPGEVRVFVAVF